MKNSNTFNQIIVDWSYFYVLPLICFTGFIFEVISSMTFIKITKNNQNAIYKYLLYYSISDALALLIYSFVGIFKCGVHCNTDKTFMAKAYELYVYLFVGNVLNTLSVFIDIKIALDRYLLMSKNASRTLFNRIPPKRVVFGFFLASILLNTPYLFVYEIEQKLNSIYIIKNETHFKYDYKIIKSNFFSNKSNNNMLVMIEISKDVLLLMFVFTINLLISLSFKKQLKKKYRSEMNRERENKTRRYSASNPHSNSKEIPKSSKYFVRKFHYSSSMKSSRIMSNYRLERRVTLMILCLCLIFLFGHVPDMLYKIKSCLHNNYRLVNFNYLPIYLIFANLMSFSTRGLNFFVYFFFNYSFREALKKIFKFK